MKLVIEMEVGLTKSRYTYANIFKLLRDGLMWFHASRSPLSCLVGDHGRIDAYGGEEVATWRIEQ